MRKKRLVWLVALVCCLFLASMAQADSEWMRSAVNGDSATGVCFVRYIDGEYKILNSYPQQVMVIDFGNSFSLRIGKEHVLESTAYAIITISGQTYVFDTENFGKTYFGKGYTDFVIYDVETVRDALYSGHKIKVELFDRNDAGAGVYSFDIDGTGLAPLLDAEFGMNYERALVLQQSGQYEDAMKLFKKIAYKDSITQVTECKYLLAVSLKNAGSYREADYIFPEIYDYKDSRDLAGEMRYAIAESLQNKGEYLLASRFYQRAFGWKDADAKKQECLSKIVVGETVKFGSYDIDSDGTKEPLLWTVLAVEDNKALLHSNASVKESRVFKYSYDRRDWDILSDYYWAWNNSYEKEWLYDFYLEAFSDYEEQFMVAFAYDHVNPRRRINFDGESVDETALTKETNDLLFPLSISEFEKYKPIIYSTQKQQPTWLLRTDGYMNYYGFEHVYMYRYVVTEEGDISYKYEGNAEVRPACWVKLP